MNHPAAFIPRDRLQSIRNGKPLSTKDRGCILFADIDGYTSLIRVVAQQLGRSKGADILTKTINQVFELLVSAVHQYGGSIVGFGGDAIIAWFSGDEGARSVSCALSIQQAMDDLLLDEIPKVGPVKLSVKIAIAQGNTRRLTVGDPNIKQFDLLAGEVTSRLAVIVPLVQDGEIVVAQSIARQLDGLQITERRTDENSGQQAIVITGTSHPVAGIVQNQPTIEPFDSTGVELFRGWLLQPVYEKLVHASGDFLAEIRHCTVLFLKFTGINFVDDTHCEENLHDYICAIQQILDTHHGHLFKITIDDKGSYVMVVFGAPTTTDDVNNMALMSALEMRNAAEKRAYIDSVQIGISRGKVLAGAFGNEWRATYDVLGDDANIAARLMVEADCSEILISSTAKKESDLNYQFVERNEPLHVRGIEEPLIIYALAADREPQTPIYSTKLVGRQQEIERLTSLRNRAVKGEGQVVWIEAEAGIGKSHLVAEFAWDAEMEGFMTARGLCRSTHESIPYYCWKQILLSLTQQVVQRDTDGDLQTNATQLIEGTHQILITVNSEWQDRQQFIGELLDLDTSITNQATDPRERQAQLINLVSDFMWGLSRKQPLLLTIEDAHWMDEASKSLTVAVSRVLGEYAAMLMLSARPLPNATYEKNVLTALTEFGHGSRIELGPLVNENLMAVVEQQLGDTVDLLFMDLIERQCQGNPFYVEEFLFGLREAERIDFDPGRCCWMLSAETVETLQAANCLEKNLETGDLRLAVDAVLTTVGIDKIFPQSSPDLILSRVGRLSETSQFTLKLASTAGDSFNANWLVATEGESQNTEPLSEQLQNLVDRAFIVPEPQNPSWYMFRHGLTQNTVYSILIEDQKEVLHNRMGEAIESIGPQDVERLAYHYGQTKQLDKKIYYWEQAARKNQQEHANETALNHYNSLLELDERLEWIEGKIEIAQIVGRSTLLSEAIEQLRNCPTASEFQIYFYEAKHATATGELDTALMYGEMALEQLSDDQLYERACCFELLGEILRRRAKYEQAVKYLEDALVLFEQIGGSAEVEREMTNTWIHLINIARQQSKYAEAKRYCQQVLERAIKNGSKQSETRARNELAAVAYYQRDFELAVQQTTHSLRTQRSIGDLRGEGINLQYLGVFCLEQGQYDKAEQYFRQSLALNISTDDMVEEANTRNALSALYYLMGNFSVAQHEAHNSLRLYEKIKDEYGMAHVLGNLGQIIRDQGRLQQSISYFQKSRAIGEKLSEGSVTTMADNDLAIVHLRDGNPSMAIQLASASRIVRAVELKAAELTTSELATIAMAYHKMDNEQRAIDHAKMAVALLDSCQGVGPENPHRDYYLCARVFYEAGYYKDAHDALIQAQSIIQRRADEIADPMVRSDYLSNAPMVAMIMGTVFESPQAS